MRRIAVLTSGGDAPGMNAAIRAVVRSGINRGLEVLGVRRGYHGLMRADFVPLDSAAVGGIIEEGGTVLRSSRSAEFRSPEGQGRALAALRREQVDGLVVIGGNGSQAGALALHRLGFPVVGIASTIDNDLLGIDWTVGADTALNTVVEAIDRIRDTASAHERTFVVETMGRDCGWLALHAALATGADIVLVPEIPFDLEEVGERVRERQRAGKAHTIVVVAEGAASAFEVAREITERTGVETRVTVLGHVQRGGPPTAFDRVLATRLGVGAVKELLAGRSGVVMGLRGGQVVAVPAEEATSGKPALDVSELEGLFTL